MKAKEGWLVEEIGKLKEEIRLMTVKQDQLVKELETGRKTKSDEETTAPASPAPAAPMAHQHHRPPPRSPRPNHHKAKISVLMDGFARDFKMRSMPKCTPRFHLFADRGRILGSDNIW
jgi:hypothetical protein